MEAKVILTNLSLSTKSSTANGARYLHSVGEEHRKRFGQFFTPQEVADFMVRWVLGSKGGSLYDPGFGLGAFYTPVVESLEVSFEASEVDPVVVDFWQKTTGRDASFVCREDYLLSWGKKRTNIVCNPPYMRFQKFLNRDSVLDAFAKNSGLRLSGYTNIASAFLLKSLSELDGTGRLAYIMPLEFLNTGYGKVVKSNLVERGHLAAIIRLDCEKEIFPDAITSVGIILYDAVVHHEKVNFYSVDSVASLSTVFERAPVASVPLHQLPPNAKWMQHFVEVATQLDTGSLVPLNQYGHFSRGIATGANKFFVLRPSQVQAIGLDDSEYVPCLTRSAQVRQAIFSDNNYERLLKADAPVLLFSASSRHTPAAERYIKFGEAHDYHKRFLTKNRTPWYKTEIRTPAPILMGVFSRGDYKVIRNISAAVNLSCFHGFHPNFYGHDYIDRIFLYLASRTGRTVLGLSARKYGDELDKFEPNDLNHALAPASSIFDAMPRDLVQSAMAYVAENGDVPEYVDEFFAEIVHV